FFSVVDLLMHLSLIVVPDAIPRPRENRPDREQKLHLTWLEDAALTVHQGIAGAVVEEADRQVVRRELIASDLQAANLFERSSSQHGIARVSWHSRPRSQNAA